MAFSKLHQKSEGVIRAHDLRRPRVRVLYGLFVLICVGTLLVATLPLIWTILGGFKTMQEYLRGIKTTGPDGKNVFVMYFLPQSFSFEGYVETWKKLRFYRYYLNSFWVVLGSMASALLINGLFAYGLSRLKPRGWKVGYGLVMGSLLLPATTSIVPLFINLSRLGLTGSFIPLWLSAGASAFYVILFKNFYDAMPESLLEAARLDGCTNLTLFFRIVLPLSMPINMVVMIYTVNSAWSDFLLPYLLLNNTNLETVMVRLFAFRTSTSITPIEVLRSLVFSILPPIVLFFLFQRYITSNVMAAGIKG